MNKKLLLSILTLMVILSGYSQNAIWNRITTKNIENLEKLERTSQPTTFNLYNLNLNNLKQQLQQVPIKQQEQSSNVILPFPNRNGEFNYYRIYEAPVMHHELSAKHQGIKTYIGQDINDASAIIRFSITPFGFHNMLQSVNGTTYTDPYTKDLQTYIVYKREGLTTSQSFHCDVIDNGNHNNQKNVNQPLSVAATDGVLRTYRLAMACTIEYAAFHVNAADLNDGTLAEKKEAVLAAMVITVNRVNSIYERDLSITLELVPDNEDVIFINDDNFDNANTDGILLNQSQNAIDNAIGFNNYDIGHTVSTGGGGLAQLFSPCSGSKARGITGLPSPVGDPFDVDYVAHEMGHQFGGNHSYNNSCNGNRSNDNAYEPGSGSTIMAYAGICAPNVQSNSDAHFHANSIAEITAFITNWGDCSENTITGNIPPVIDAGLDYTIPYGTPFILSGTATDANNDIMTYNWEQMDNEISEQPPLANATDGPNFRSLPSKELPERFMPDIESVINNDLAPTWEVISDVAREFNFAFTVRDNNVAGGQTVIDYMKVDVSGTAGPFIVTMPNAAVSWQAGTHQDVEWDVAGTTTNGVNTPYVDIFLSTDGGYTYPVILAAKVPNDGSEIVSVPNLLGNANRIMVKGHDNIFYDISNTNFTIIAPATTMAIAVSGAQNIANCIGNEVSYELNYNAYSGFNSDTTFAVTGNPDGTTVTFSPEIIVADGTVTMTVVTTESTPAGFYTMPVVATSGGVTKTINVYLDLIDANFGTLSLISPVNSATQVFDQTSFDWVDVANATGYQIEVAGDENFTDIIIDAIITDSNYIAVLEGSEQYYWRVRPINENCSGSYSDINGFVTGITECNDYTATDAPVIIPDNTTSIVNSVIAATGDAPIQKVSVTLDISHTWVSDLTVTLISPQGTEVQLFSDECDDADDVQATFDDSGELSVCGTVPVLSGVIQPDEALSIFNGELPEGEWMLELSDVFDEDGGAINSWSLTICTTEEATAIIENNLFTNFTLYPNPNNGDFTIRYTSATGDDINVMVHDIRGRQLLSNTYRNTGLFENNLSLGTVEAGVYLVTVQDGSNKITKKIVVQ
ncbi:T9SS C-terminal target domain-containing protein [Flavobacterium arcticum]|uniref:T9SS C-terminal target domain-containing protein n=1 Tax=Flavobacterium arcticum TaxID=1784713 RepID=A0A345HAG3_9FLAO|nr:zinc-dependent metalloprotease family protein [Flavobacterium arcticum]AXG73573.1 T9SS C-terminal target domain-containing protein [Flavobacterium arcticum]KAF2513366.1 T9SS type A sorting domain-containing protein [Flavobacterium arcticum]